MDPHSIHRTTNQFSVQQQIRMLHIAIPIWFVKQLLGRRTKHILFVLRPHIEADMV